MSHSQHYETAPEDRISFAHKLIYGLGAFVNNLLAGARVARRTLSLSKNPRRLQPSESDLGAIHTMLASPHAASSSAPGWPRKLESIFL